jgi:putative tricarboxylic transport membrane protein
LKRIYQITSVVLMCMAMYIAQDSLKMKYYTPLGPGPGFLSLWLSIFLAILAATMFWKATFGRPEVMPADFYEDRNGYLRIGVIIGAIVGVVVLLEPLGFRLTMLGVYLFLLTALGRQHALLTVIIALSGSFGVYHVFVHWLSTSLPVGLFGF